MIIFVQKEFTGGNGRGTYDYQLEHGYELEDQPVNDSPMGSEDEKRIVVPEFIKDRLKAQKVDTISNNVHEPWNVPDTPRKIKDPVSKDNSVAEDPEVQDEIENPVDNGVDNKRNISTGAKAGLAAAGIAAVGAAGYGAYRALRKRKARKDAINAEVDKFFKNKEVKKD